MSSSAAPGAVPEKDDIFSVWAVTDSIWLVFTIILEVSCLMLSATVVSSSYSLRVDALFDFVILFFESLNNLLIIVDNNSW